MAKKPRRGTQVVSLRVTNGVAQALEAMGPAMAQRLEKMMREELRRMAAEARASETISPETGALGVPAILEDMAKTFRERNAVYKDNWKMVGRIMVAMFPNGVTLKTAADYDVWHLFELQIVKLSRFAISGLTHEDSIHDLVVYGAMVEAIIKQRKEQKAS